MPEAQNTLGYAISVTRAKARLSANRGVTLSVEHVEKNKKNLLTIFNI